MGVIDSSYRGEIIVAIHNDSNETQLVHNGDRIAQLVIQKVEPTVFEEVSELDETSRGESGFGGSGK